MKKIITIIKNFSKSLGTIISILKGHQGDPTKPVLPVLYNELRKSFLPILTPSMIRDVFIGKDLMQMKLRKIESF